MPENFIDKWLNRLKGAWHVLIGRAWTGYGNPSDWEYVGRDVETK